MNSVSVEAVFEAARSMLQAAPVERQMDGVPRPAWQEDYA
jgi:hypothetical protein